MRESSDVDNVQVLSGEDDLFVLIVIAEFRKDETHLVIRKDHEGVCLHLIGLDAWKAGDDSIENSVLEGFIVLRLEIDCSGEATIEEALDDFGSFVEVTVLFVGDKFCSVVCDFLDSEQKLGISVKSRRVQL